MACIDKDRTDPSSPAQKAKLIRQMEADHGKHHFTIVDRDNAYAAYQAAVKRVENAQQNRGAAVLNALPVRQAFYIAEQDLQEHTNALGGLKGIHIRFFGFEFKTRGRKTQRKLWRIVNSMRKPRTTPNVL